MILEQSWKWNVKCNLWFNDSILVYALTRDWNLRLMKHPTKANKWRKNSSSRECNCSLGAECVLAEIEITRHELHRIAVFCPPPNHSFVVVAMKREEKKVNIDQKIKIMIRYDHGVCMMSELHRIIFLLVSATIWIKGDSLFCGFWRIFAISSCNYVSFFNIGLRIVGVLRKYERENYWKKNCSRFES